MNPALHNRIRDDTGVREIGREKNNKRGKNILRKGDECFLFVCLFVLLCFFCLFGFLFLRTLSSLNQQVVVGKYFANSKSMVRVIY